MGHKKIRKYKLDFMNIKNLHPKDTVKKQKRQIIDGRKCLQNTHLTKDLNPRHKKGSKNLILLRQTVQQKIAKNVKHLLY